MVFRVKKSVPVDGIMQGYIYYVSLLYSRLPEDKRNAIRRLCMEAGGKEYYRALFEFVTTEAGATAICLKHHLSRATLFRLVHKYYTNFPSGV